MFPDKLCSAVNGYYSIGSKKLQLVLNANDVPYRYLPAECRCQVINDIEGKSIGLRHDIKLPQINDGVQTMCNGSEDECVTYTFLIKTCKTGGECSQIDRNGNDHITLTANASIVFDLQLQPGHGKMNAMELQFIEGSVLLQGIAGMINNDSKSPMSIADALSHI